MKKTIQQNTRFHFGWPLQALAALIINILSLALPVMMLQVYDRIIPHQAYDTLFALILGVAAALTMDAALRLMRAYLLGHAASEYEENSSNQALNHLLKSDFTEFEKTGTATHIQNINALSRLREFYSGQTITALVDLPFVVLFLGLIWYLGGALVVVPLVLLITFALFAILTGWTLRNALDRKAKRDDEKTNFILSVFSGIHSVKALSIESYLMRKFTEIQNRMTQASHSLANASGTSVLLSSAFGQLALVLTVTAGGYLVVNGGLSVGALSACILLSGRTIQPLQRILSTWLRLQDLELSHEQAERLFTMPLQKRSNDELSQPQGSLSVTNLSYKNHSSGVYFENISFNVQQGEMIAIHGDHSGDLSALLQMIAGLLHPTSGSVMIDDINPVDHAPHTLAAHIGYLSQSPTIFKGTIIENMTGFSDDLMSIINAKDMASELGLDNIVNLLPNGYETYLSDSVTDTISPGTKQRISLVRILARHPAILIFDAADMGLDKIGYDALLEVVKKIKGKQTMIVVSGDRNFFGLADRFYMLTKGQMLRQPAAIMQQLKYQANTNTGEAK